MTVMPPDDKLLNANHRVGLRKFHPPKLLYMIATPDIESLRGHKLVCTQTLHELYPEYSAFNTLVLNISVKMGKGASRQDSALFPPICWVLSILDYLNRATLKLCPSPFGDSSVVSHSLSRLWRYERREVVPILYLN